MINDAIDLSSANSQDETRREKFSAIHARIAILEDESVVAMDLRGRLERLGYSVVGVYGDGISALAGIAKIGVDLALLDISLGSGMSGINVGSQLRDRYNIPFIYLTAYSDQDTLKNAKMTEPFGYLVKPISDAELKTTIEIALYKYQAEQERKKVEEESKQLREQLFQVQKMDAVGKLAAGIAHDLNNSLTAVIGNLEYLTMLMVPNSKMQDCLDLTIQGCRRSSKLIQQLLAFSQQGKYELKTSSLSTVVEKVIRFLARVIENDGIKINLQEMHGQYMPVNLCQVQIEQVIINLVMNAKESMNSTGVISLSYDKEYISKPTALNANAVPGNYFVLQVKDNGHGMSEETKERIFEPFFTTKITGKGTGLGLAMVYGSMQSHGGWVSVDSVLDVGTTVRLYFPESKELISVQH